MTPPFYFYYKKYFRFVNPKKATEAEEETGGLPAF